MGIQEPREGMAPRLAQLERAAGGLTQSCGLCLPGKEESQSRSILSRKNSVSGARSLPSTSGTQKAIKRGTLGHFSGCVQANTEGRRFNRKIEIRHQEELLFAGMILLYSIYFFKFLKILT